MKFPDARKLIVLLLSGLLSALPAAAAETVLTAVSDDGSQATLTLFAAPLKTMTPTELHLTLSGARGPAPQPQAASCDLTMPAMPMPKNRPELECGALVCSGSATFTMAGAWEAACEVRFADGRRSRYVFAIEMVQLK